MLEIQYRPDVTRYPTTGCAARQAILEARANGVYPFCLTVDRDEGAEYLAHVFGQSGYAILRQPDQLPLAFLKGAQHLLVT